MVILSLPVLPSIEAEVPDTPPIQAGQAQVAISKTGITMTESRTDDDLKLRIVASPIGRIAGEISATVSGCLGNLSETKSKGNCGSGASSKT